jgi:hypothetical protein
MGAFLMHDMVSTRGGGTECREGYGEDGERKESERDLHRAESLLRRSTRKL